MINKREDPTIGPMTFYQWDVRLVHPEKGSRVLRWPVYGKPAVVDDRVFLFPGKDQENKKLVIQQLDSRRHTVMNLPRDCDPYFGSPGVSPCGRMLAYYALSPDSAQARIRVVRIERNWPLVAESAWHETVGTDVAPTPPRWDDGKKVVGDPLFFYFQNDDQDNQVIVPLMAVDATDLTVSAHSEHLIEIAMIDPEPTDCFDTEFSPDSSQLLLRSQDRFRLVLLDKPLTVGRIESTPAHDARSLLFLPGGGLVAHTDKETLLFKPGKHPRTIYTEPIWAYGFESRDILAISDKVRRARRTSASP